MLNWLRRPDAKELGNEAFKEKNLDEAVLQYTRGLERCQGTAQTEERSKLLANRSAAHAKLGNYEAALADAEEASRLQPDWPKAWARKGKALSCLQRHKNAASSYARGLEAALTLMQKNDERHKLCESRFIGAFVLNRRVDLHAIDAALARWRGDAASSPLDGASTAASSPRNDLVENYGVHTGHERELEALQKQAKTASDSYLTLLGETETLKRQLEDYTLMFGERETGGKAKAG